MKSCDRDKVSQHFQSEFFLPRREIYPFYLSSSLTHYLLESFYITTNCRTFILVRFELLTILMTLLNIQMKNVAIELFSISDIFYLSVIHLQVDPESISKRNELICFQILNCLRWFPLDISSSHLLFYSYKHKQSLLFYNYINKQWIVVKRVNSSKANCPFTILFTLKSLPFSSRSNVSSSYLLILNFLLFHTVIKYIQW